METAQPARRGRSRQRPALLDPPCGCYASDLHNQACKHHDEKTCFVCTEERWKRVKRREIGNLILHIAGGALMAVAVMYQDYLIVAVIAVWGLLREQAQHRDEGFFGWINGHRLFEASQWVIGASLGTIGWLLFA